MAFIKRHALLTYFALTFAISWGGFVMVLGRGGLASANWEAEAGFAYAVAAMLAGPTVAGILLTAFIDGRARLREMLSRLLRWRASVRWYAFAILPAPLLAVAVLLALKLPAPIFTATDKAGVVASGIVASLTAVFEEVGWMGFALPRIRRRHGVFATGLMLGVVWGAWHLLQQIFISGTYAGGLPPALYLTLAIGNTVAGLTAYRVLMVWLYDRTGSLLIATIMHSSLIASTIFIFRPEASGPAFMAYSWTFTAAMWLVVAAVAAISRGHLSQPGCATLDFPTIYASGRAGIATPLISSHSASGTSKASIGSHISDRIGPPRNPASCSGRQTTRRTEAKTPTQASRMGIIRPRRKR